MGKIWWFITLSIVFWLIALRVWGWYDFPFLREKPARIDFMSNRTILSEGVFLLPSLGFGQITEKDQNKAIIISKALEVGVNYRLALEIAKRESGFVSDVCNFKYGCKSGQGIYQLIPSTHRYCEKKLGRKLDVFKAEDNIDCGLYLLKTDGIGHWNKWSGPYNDYD